MKTLSIFSPLFAVVLGCLGFVTHAQTSEGPVNPSGQVTSLSCNTETGINDYWSAGLGLMYGMPLMDLKDAQYRDGVALHFEVFTPSLLPKSSWIHPKLGIHFDGMVSGWESAEILLQDPVGELADYSITNSSYGGNLMLRLTTKPMAVMPYIDGFIGGRWFRSVEKISLDDSWEDDYETDLRDQLVGELTWAMGLSAGAMVKLHRGYLDFRVTYSHGGPSSSVNLNSVAPLDDAVNFQVNNSKTPLLFAQVGLVLPLTPSYGTNNVDFGDFSGFSENRNSYRSYRRSRGERNGSDDICAPRRRQNREKRDPKIKRNPKIKTSSKGSGAKS